MMKHQMALSCGCHFFRSDEPISWVSKLRQTALLQQTITTTTTRLVLVPGHFCTAKRNLACKGVLDPNIFSLAPCPKHYSVHTGFYKKKGWGGIHTRTVEAAQNKHNTVTIKILKNSLNPYCPWDKVVSLHFQIQWVGLGIVLSIPNKQKYCLYTLWLHLPQT